MTIGSDSLFGLAVFVGAYIVSRIIRERALKRLSTEQKAQLLDAFSGYRTYFMSAAVCLPLVYFLAIKRWHALVPAGLANGIDQGAVEEVWPVAIPVAIKETS